MNGCKKLGTFKKNKNFERTTIYCSLTFFYPKELSVMTIEEQIIRVSHTSKKLLNSYGIKVAIFYLMDEVLVERAAE